MAYNVQSISTAPAAVTAIHKSTKTLIKMIFKLIEKVSKGVITNVRNVSSCVD